MKTWESWHRKGFLNEYKQLLSCRMHLVLLRKYIYLYICILCSGIITDCTVEIRILRLAYLSRDFRGDTH